MRRANCMWGHSGHLAKQYISDAVWRTNLMTGWPGGRVSTAISYSKKTVWLRRGFQMLGFRVTSP